MIIIYPYGKIKSVFYNISSKNVKYGCYSFVNEEITEIRLRYYVHWICCARIWEQIAYVAKINLLNLVLTYKAVKCGGSISSTP